jgi:hypothetical protein
LCVTTEEEEKVNSCTNWEWKTGGEEKWQREVRKNLSMASTMHALKKYKHGKDHDFGGR